MDKLLAFVIRLIGLQQHGFVDVEILRLLGQDTDNQTRGGDGPTGGHVIPSTLSTELIFDYKRQPR